MNAVGVTQESIPPWLADAVYFALKLDWAEWKPFPHLPDGVDGNPMTWWWGIEWAKIGGEFRLTLAPDTVMPEPVALLRQWVERRVGWAPNAVSANRHLPPKDHGFPWHTDYEPRMDSGSVTVSLGTRRTFRVGERRDGFHQEYADPTADGFYAPDVEEVDAVSATHGTAIIWDGPSHRRYVHSVDPGEGLRYAVNFRRYRLWSEA